MINIFFILLNFLFACAVKKNWRWLNKRFGASLQCKAELMKIDSKTGTNKWPLKIKPHEWPFSLALAQHRSCSNLLNRTGFYPRFSFQSFHKDTLTEAQRHKDRSESGRLISASLFYLFLLPSTFCTDIRFSISFLCQKCTGNIIWLNFRPFRELCSIFSDSRMSHYCVQSNGLQS